VLYILLNKFDCLQAIHYRHIDVENDDVEVVLVVRSHNLNCLHSVLGNLYLKVLFKLTSVHVNHEELVISKQHLGLKVFVSVRAVVNALMNHGFWIRNSLVLKATLLAAT